MEQLSTVNMPYSGQEIYNIEKNLDPRHPGIKLELEISRDELEAYMNIFVDEKGITVDIDEIKTFLEINRIKYGIMDECLESINTLLKDNSVIEKHLVARGKPFQRGDDSRLDFKVRDDARLAEKYILEQAKKKEIDLSNEERRKKYVEDYKNQNEVFVSIIKKGDIIAQKLKPGEGKTGVTVTGKKINAHMGENVNIRIKRNVKFDSLNRIYTSMVDGLLIYDNRSIWCKFYKDGDFNIEISRDKMSASLTIMPSIGGAVPVNYKSIVKQADLKNINLFKHINLRSIAQRVEEVEAQHKYLQFEIGKGEEAIHGKDARMEYMIDLSSREKFSQDATGRIDYKSRKSIIIVKKGDWLGVLHYAAPAVQDGINVLKEKIPAKDGRDKKIIPGQNISVKEYDDRIEFYSDIDGHFKEDWETIHVLPVFQVDDDVDLSVGNIDFHGDVIIKGNILNEFSVKATGDIVVYGNVGNSFVESNGDLTIKNGFLGNGKGQLICKGDLHVKFIENGYVECRKSITVERGIINSIIKSNDMVNVSTAKGYIMGGEVHAGKKIISRVIGSQRGIKTNLFLGYDFQIRHAMNQLKEDRIKYNFDLSKVERIIDNLFKQKEMIRDFDNKMKSLYVNSVRKKIILIQELKDIHKKEAEIKKEDLVVTKKPEILVMSTVHSDVEINMLNNIFRTTEALHNIQIGRDDSMQNIIVRPLEASA